MPALKARKKMAPRVNDVPSSAEGGAVQRNLWFSVEERPFRAVKRFLKTSLPRACGPRAASAERADKGKDHALVWNPRSWASLKSELIERSRIARIWQSNPEPQSCYAIP
jgi:hypothetical protein